MAWIFRLLSIVAYELEKRVIALNLGFESSKFE